MAKLKHHDKINIKSIILKYNNDVSEEDLEFLETAFWLNVKALRIEKGKYLGNFKIDKANLLDAIKHLKKAKLSVSSLPFHYRTDESAKVDRLEKITEYINSLENFAEQLPDKFSKIDRQPLAAVWATRALAKIIGINVGVGRTNALNKLGEFGIAIFEEIFEDSPSWEHYDRLFIESDFKGEAWD